MKIVQFTAENIKRLKLAFARGSATEQFEILRQAANVEFDFGGMVRANAEDYKERTRLNKEAKQHRAAAGALTVPEDTPAEPVDVDEIHRRIHQAFEHNSSMAIQEVERRQLRDRKQQHLENAQRQHDRIQKEIERLEEELAHQDFLIKLDGEEIAALDALPPVEAKVDTKNLEREFEEAKSINVSVERRKERDSRNNAAQAQEAMAAELTQRMEGREQAKLAAIAAAKMPVEGVGLGDGFVTFNDIPLDQASDAERLRVSIGIAMATNPKLRVIRIRDGSLLDEDSMKVVVEMAKQNNFQFWCEVVGDQKTVGGEIAVVLKDGEVTFDGQSTESDQNS